MSQPGKQTIAICNCPITQEIKTIGQWNFAGLKNITGEIFFLKYHSQNVLEKLFPDLFLKNHTVCVYCMPSSGPWKYIETKLETTCFYLIKLLWEKKRRLRTTTMVIIFWEFLMFCQIFLSPQVKQCVIIAYKHGLPNDLRLRILRN